MIRSTALPPDDRDPVPIFAHPRVTPRACADARRCAPVREDAPGVVARAGSRPLHEHVSDGTYFSAVAVRQLERGPDRAPNRLGRRTLDDGLLDGLPAEGGQMLLTGPDAVVAVAEVVAHPLPELGLLHSRL